jgi:hypothetical protein
MSSDGKKCEVNLDFAKHSDVMNVGQTLVSLLFSKLMTGAT